MKIEMICTGEEVLAGQIVDTNAAWLGSQLMEAGFEMQRRTTVGDRLADLVEVFIERSLCADIILVNGGLGPTEDDLSSAAIAQAMGVTLEENSVWRKTLEAWFANREKKLSSSNLKQALLPQGAVLVDNPVGTACGFRVKFNRAWLFFTPGVPHEFKRMINDQFVPFLQEKNNSKQSVDVTKVLTIGIGESDMTQALNKLSWPQGVTLGYRSYTPYLELKLISRGVSADCQRQALEQAKAVLADHTVALNQETLAGEVHRLLVSCDSTLAVAESLTGGDICSQLVAFAGSSHYLQQGVVSYSNAAKITLLNVEQQCIDTFSEVSLRCVAQMAHGAANINLKQSTRFSIATSGVAGPSGGTEQNPVGSVVLAVKVGERIHCQKIQISKLRNRNYIRDLSAAVVLDMLRRAILSLNPIADYAYITRTDSAVFSSEDVYLNGPAN